MTFTDRLGSTPDGQRCLVNLESTSSSSPITAILNWKPSFSRKYDTNLFNAGIVNWLLGAH
jgi:hypothetical protein